MFLFLLSKTCENIKTFKSLSSYWKISWFHLFPCCPVQARLHTNRTILSVPALVMGKSTGPCFAAVCVGEDSL